MLLEFTKFLIKYKCSEACPKNLIKKYNKHVAVSYLMK